MTTTGKNTLRDVMNLAWHFVRKNGYMRIHEGEFTSGI